MEIEIINTPLNLIVHGFSGTAVGKDYAGTAFKLMNRMWQIVKTNHLANKGFNIWVYEPDGKVFAGVELDGPPKQNIELEQKTIAIKKYAYYKHIGSYNLIKQVGKQMREELEKKGFEILMPYMEIYGHWAEDESKLETELLMNLK